MNIGALVCSYRSSEIVATYAPLYCATSSPRINTFSFCSISSAIASFSASRTVISLTPDAYPRRANVGRAAVLRNALRGAGRAAAAMRQAGLNSLEAAIAGVTGGGSIKGRKREGRSFEWAFGAAERYADGDGHGRFLRAANTNSTSGIR